MRTRAIELFAAAFLAAVGVWAQTDAGIQIHGVVREIGLNAGLAGAEVRLFEFAGPEREKTLFATTATDPNGEFLFHPARFGDYWIEVKKQAYFSSIPIAGVGSLNSVNAKPPAEETGSLTSVNAAHPSQEVRYALMRPGELTGTVVDEAGEPVGRAVVEITNAGLPGVARTALSANGTGRFTVTMLMPGEYVVKISPPRPPSATPAQLTPAQLYSALPKFTEDDLKVVDEELQAIYWPGAFDPQSASPARVSPGTPTDLGTIRMRKTPSYRVRVSMQDCKSDALPYLAVATPNDHNMGVMLMGTAAMLPFIAPPVTSCDDFLVRDLKPGSYTFFLSSAHAWASAPVEIANKNREVTLRLSSGVDISGVVVIDKTVAEGGTLPALDKLQIQMLPADGPGVPARASPPDAKGAFLARNVLGSAYRINVSGLSDKYCVKEIRVDGQAVPDSVARLYQGSVLEIVLDDQPSSILGSVADGDKPFSLPLVFVAKWPSLAEAKPVPITGDDSGHFQIAGLDPGEYRVLAVPSTPLPDGLPINQTMLSKLWNDAERVTLERGGSKTVALKLSDPLQ